jgi:serine/threonine protein kinase
MIPIAEPLAAADHSLVMGRYRLGRRLGRGGFGTVFEAYDERLERLVAVKVVPCDVVQRTSDSEVRPDEIPDRATREALAAARLDHPGIVAVYDAGEEPGARYLVSELVRGQTLAELEVNDALSDRDVLRVGLALADALAHAHERGVVHRDVKPQNVMVPARATSGRGAAKLTDFGVAHLVDDDALTRTGDVVGTLAYMAPEQAEGHRVDARTDLYSLGLVLYEALAGTNPVRGASPAATARKVGSVLPALARHRPDLPPALCAALDRAVRPKPGERGTLIAVSDALVDALDEVEDVGGAVARHPLEGPRRLPSPPRLVRGRRRGSPPGPWSPPPSSPRPPPWPSRRSRRVSGRPSRSRSCPGWVGSWRRPDSPPRSSRRAVRAPPSSSPRPRPRSHRSSGGPGRAGRFPRSLRCSAWQPWRAAIPRSPAGRARRAHGPAWGRSAPGGWCSPSPFSGARWRSARASGPRRGGSDRRRRRPSGSSSRP